MLQMIDEEITTPQGEIQMIPHSLEIFNQKCTIRTINRALHKFVNERNLRDKIKTLDTDGKLLGIKIRSLYGREEFLITVFTTLKSTLLEILEALEIDFVDESKRQFFVPNAPISMTEEAVRTTLSPHVDDIIYVDMFPIQKGKDLRCIKVCVREKFWNTEKGKELLESLQIRDDGSRPCRRITIDQSSYILLRLWTPDSKPSRKRRNTNNLKSKNDTPCRTNMPIPNAKQLPPNFYETIYEKTEKLVTTSQETLARLLQHTQHVDAHIELLHGKVDAANFQIDQLVKLVHILQQTIVSVMEIDESAIEKNTPKCDVELFTSVNKILKAKSNQEKPMPRKSRKREISRPRSPLEKKKLRKQSPQPPTKLKNQKMNQEKLIEILKNISQHLEKPQT